MISNYYRLPSIRDSLMALKSVLEDLSDQHFIVVPYPARLLNWTEMSITKITIKIDKLKKSGWKEIKNDDGMSILIKGEKE